MNGKLIVNDLGEWLNSLREVRSNIPPEDVGKKYVQVAVPPFWTLSRH